SACAGGSTRGGDVAPLGRIRTMPDFTETRDQLSQARSRRESVRQELFLAQESRKRLQAERAAFLRIFDEKDRTQRARKKAFDEKESVLNEKISRLRSAADAAAKNETTWFDRFQEFSDPRQAISLLSDSTPLLLFPLRMETRFKTLINAEGASRHELWVRVYPDECVIDTFEDVLSEQEIESGQRYWIDYWRAGGVEEQRRAAWRGLVASHGSGRGLWITDHYNPLNPGDEPVQGASDDIVLVIATDLPPSAAEQAAARTYWTAIWRADGDAAQEQAALAALRASVGDVAADNIRENLQPTNLTESPRPPKKRSDVTVSAAFLVFPKPEDTPAKQHSWTQPSRVNLLPDRLVLTGYSDGHVIFQRLGNPIPSPLAAGPDPNAPPDQQLRQKDGEIVVDDEMKWMVDFERAVQVGMGFRVSLEAAQARLGFDRLVVLGVRLSSKEDEGQQ